MKINSLLLTILSLVLLCSCTGYNKLLKGTDVEAKYAEGVKLYHAKKYNKAVGLFDNIYSSVMGTLREDTLLFYSAKSHYNLRNYETARQSFDTYRNRFTRSYFAEESEYLYAMCNYKASLPYEKDQANTRQAIIAFNEYLNRYPESAQVEDIHTKITELTQRLYRKTYENAALYHKLGHFNAAITALRFAIKEQPEIPFREDMMYLICRSWYDYAKHSVFARQLDRYMKMIDSYYNFKTAFPESERFNKELERMFEDAQLFTKTYGVQAQEAQKYETAIEEHKKNIEIAKDQLFSTETKAERQSLKNTIKRERAAIKEQKELVKTQSKELRIERQLTKSQAPKTTKENKATKESKLLKEPEAPNTPKAPKEPKAPKTPKTPKEKKAKNSTDVATF